jgi:membrane-bound serine protease (ClpP class)
MGMKTITIILISLLLLPQVTSHSHIDVIKIDGSINPASAGYIHDRIKSANTGNAECLIIEFNTPGGLLKSTRNIVSDIFASRIPIVIYVYPSGAQAASAGVFITLASNIAVMAPGTNIGAAHPVMMNEGGTTDKKDSLDIMTQKAANDAAAFIRSIAEKRHRNISWAEKAVFYSLSLSETEALKENIIDFVALNMDSLIKHLDGYKVETGGGVKIIQTKHAEVRIIEMTLFQKFLDLISDPNLAYILMMLGFYGLIFELSNPGSILPGIVGMISIILAFYSFSSLPVNFAGFALIIFAFILFIAEIKIVSHGLLAAGGIISFLIGSIMLISTDVSIEFIHISLSIIISATVLTALFFIFAVGKGLAAQRLKPVTGQQGMLGEIGTALSNLEPGLAGQILVHGEIWQADCTEGKIQEGMIVKVTAIHGLNLIVKKA